MSEESELKSSQIDGSKNGNANDLVSDVEESDQENEKSPALEEEISYDSVSSFKPLSFPTGENSEFHSGYSIESAKEKTDIEKINLSEGFKNSEFFYENSLLTNAEEFAKSIREGATLHKTQLLSKIEKKANDTELLQEKIINENNEAKKQREDLLSSAKEQVEEIKKDAFQDGYNDGYKIGMQKRYEEAEPLVKQANSFLEELNSLRKVIRFRTEKELVSLALMIARNVVTEEISLNDSVIGNITKKALQETEMQGKILLYLNPNDYEFLIKSRCDLEKYVDEGQNLFIRKRVELEPGSIIVETDGEVISRSIDSQFKKIEETLKKHIEKSEANLKEIDSGFEDLAMRESTKSGNDLESESLGEETTADDVQNEELEETSSSKNEIGSSSKEVLTNDFESNNLDHEGFDLVTPLVEQEENLQDRSINGNKEEKIGSDKQIKLEEDQNKIIVEESSEIDNSSAEELVIT